MILDGIVVLILAFAAWQGWKRGLVASLLGAVTLYLAVVISMHFSNFTAEFLAEHFDWSKQLPAFSFYVITFLAIIIGGALLIKVITKTLDFAGIGIVNRASGAVLGAFFGLYALSTGFWYANEADLFSQELQDSSQTLSIVLDLAPAFTALTAKVLPLARGLFNQ